MTAAYTENPLLETIALSLETHIKPLLPGAVMSGPYRGGISPALLICYDTKHRLRIYLPSGLEQFFVFERTHPFSEEERSFMEEIIQGIRSAAFAGKQPLEAAAASATLAVSRYAAPEFPETVARVVKIYEAWLACGKVKTAHTTGIRLMRHADTLGNIFDPVGERLAKALGTNPDALVIIDVKGGIRAIEKFPSPDGENRRGQDIFAPVGHAGVAAWANSRRKVAIRMTGDGTILLFNRGQLLFTRKNGVWRSPPHTLANIASIPESIDGVAPETVTALYLTALDLTSGNRASRIGLIRTSAGRRLPGMWKEKTRFPKGSARKNAKLLAGMIHAQKFHEIPRTIRAEVCSLGGVLFLDGQGSILGLDLSENEDIAADGLNGSRDEKRQAFPGSAYMELLNRDGSLNLRLAIY